MKSTLTPYLVPTLSILNSVSTTGLPEGYPVLCYEDSSWYRLDGSSWVKVPGTVNVVKNATITTITATTSNTAIDFAVASRFIDLTLQTNTFLTLSNIEVGVDFYIRVTLNNYAITNMAQLGHYDSDFNTRLLLDNSSSLLLKVSCPLNTTVEKIFDKPLSTLPKYVSLVTANQFYAPLENNATELFASYSYIESNTSYDGYSLRLTSTGQLSYNTTTNLDFNNSDFQLEFFILRENTGQTGSLVSKYSDTNRLFWSYIENNELKVKIKDFNSEFELVADITGKLNRWLCVVLTKSYLTYRLFVDGELADYAFRNTRLMPQITTPLTIGKLNNATSLGVLANTSFSGKITAVRVNLASSAYYEHYSYAPKDTLFSNVKLLYRFDIKPEEITANKARTFTSDLTSNPFLVDSGTGRRDSSYLNSTSHFEIAGSGVNFVSGSDFCIEAWVNNSAANPRATILHYGTNLTFGIYDGKLRLQGQNSALDITSVSDISNSTWNHVAVTRAGNTYRFYINGILDYSNTISGINLDADNSSPVICIKRNPAQDNAPALNNTTLYPSKNTILLDSLRITIGNTRYINNFIPTYFSII